jgi:hypothetical protein
VEVPGEPGEEGAMLEYSDEDRDEDGEFGLKLHRVDGTFSL